MSVAVQLDKVSVQVGRKLLLEEVSCTFEAGKLNALIGPNGAGKTTLLHLLLGFMPYQGNILYEGIERPRIGFVPQRPEIDRGAPVSVFDFLSSGLTHRPVWLGISRKVRGRVLKILDGVGIADRGGLLIGDLSGGEFQRVLLAQALLRNPDLLLLDEPQTGVDITGAELFCRLIEEVHLQFGVTTILVTHDIGVVADHARQVIGLNRKVLFQGRSPESLTADNLVKLFGPHSSLMAVRNRSHAPRRKAESGEET